MRPYLLAPRAMRAAEIDEGWWKPGSANRYHYFRFGRSFCGRWGADAREFYVGLWKLGVGGFEAESGVAEEPGPDDCAPCWRKRWRETRAGEAR